MEYKVAFTNLAKAFSSKVGGVAAVEEQVRGEIAEMDMESVEDLFFYIVFMKDTNGQAVEFMVKPSSMEANTLLVDTATYQQEDVLSVGFFKGKTVMMPYGDSDDD